MTQGDRLDFPAGVIRSLLQADPFPCSVASLGRTDLFKALELPACARNPMATRDLIRAPGKREISFNPLPLITSIQPRSRDYRIYPGNTHSSFCPIYLPSFHVFTYGFISSYHSHNIEPSIIVQWKTYHS